MLAHAPPALWSGLGHGELRGMSVRTGATTTALPTAMLCPFHQHVRPQVARTQLPTPAPSGDFDPNLLKPVTSQAPPPRSAAEVARLKSGVGSLHRKLATTQRAIDQLTTQLTA
jgi:hypothetical protein